MKFQKALIVINPAKDHSDSVAKQLKEILNHENIAQEWVETYEASRRSAKRLNDLS